MKNLFLIAFSFSLVFLASCTKDESITPSTTTSDSALSFKMDGTTDFKSSVVGTAWDANAKILNISSKSGKSIFTISVNMPSGLKAGTYSFSSSTAANLTTATLRPDSTIITTDYRSDSDATSNGTLTISNMTADSLITGTFSFNLKTLTTNKAMKIDLGQFSALKITIPKVVSLTSQTVSMKVDGSAFKAGLVQAQIMTFGTTKQISITAVTATSAINFTIATGVVPGTYVFDNSSDFSVNYNPNTMGFDSYFPKKGTNQIIISAHDKTNKTIKGTFKMTAGEILVSTGKTYAITEGVIDIKY